VPATNSLHSFGERRGFINRGDLADRWERLDSTPRWSTNPVGPREFGDRATNESRWFDSILVRQFLESRLMAGHRPLKSADVGSTPTFPTILFTGGLLVSQSRFEREPRRSDSYSVIHSKEGNWLCLEEIIRFWGGVVMKELLVSLDLELNQPSRRIIQIGAVVGNIRTGEIVSRFDSKVSPDEELSPAIVKLTKIKQEEVDAAPKVREAYESLKRWLDPFAGDRVLNPITWVTHIRQRVRKV
jgi:hypothetical protein